MNTENTVETNTDILLSLNATNDNKLVKHGVFNIAKNIMDALRTNDVSFDKYEGVVIKHKDSKYCVTLSSKSLTCYHNNKSEVIPGNVLLNADIKDYPEDILKINQILYLTSTTISDILIENRIIGIIDVVLDDHCAKSFTLNDNISHDFGDSEYHPEYYVNFEGQPIGFKTPKGRIIKPVLNKDGNVEIRILENSKLHQNKNGIDKAPKTLELLVNKLFKISPIVPKLDPGSKKDKAWILLNDLQSNVSNKACDKSIITNDDTYQVTFYNEIIVVTEMSTGKTHVIEKNSFADHPELLDTILTQKDVFTEECGVIDPFINLINQKEEI